MISPSPKPSRDDSESVWGVPGGDDGHELSDGVVARWPVVCTPFTACSVAVTGIANGDDFTGVWTVQGEFGEPCFL